VKITQYEGFETTGDPQLTALTIEREWESRTRMNISSSRFPSVAQDLSMGLRRGDKNRGQDRKSGWAVGVSGPPDVFSRGVQAIRSSLAPQTKNVGPGSIASFRRADGRADGRTRVASQR